jgi:hypothetical protein
MCGGMLGKREITEYVQRSELQVAFVTKEEIDLCATAFRTS